MVTVQMTHKHKPRTKRKRARRLGLLLAVVILVPLGYYAYARFARGNFHDVVPGKAYRSAQPTSRQFERWQADVGIKTVINLRGSSELPFHSRELEDCRRLGLDHIDIELSAVRPPPAPQIIKLIDALESSDKPILMHCRDGADRVGVASGIAAMALGGESFDQARNQLSWRYFHVNPWGNRVVAIFEQYQRHCDRENIDTGGWEQFRDWARNLYRPEYYWVEIQAPEQVLAQPGQELRIEARVLHQAHTPLPLSDTGKQFNLAVFLGSSEQDKPDRELGPRTHLTGADLSRGQSIVLSQIVRAPASPGVYEVHFDLVEERRTWFARQGSQVGTMMLRVSDNEGPPDSREVPAALIGRLREALTRELDASQVSRYELLPDANARRLQAHRDLLAGDANEALAGYDLLLSWDPNDIGSLRGRATALSAAGRYAQAAQAYKAVLARSPNDFNASYNLAVTEIRLGLFADALSRLGALALARPDDFKVLMNLAQVHRQLGHVAQARQYLTRASTVDPNSPGPYARLAELALSLGLPIEAMKYATRAANADPNSPDRWLDMARCCMLAGSVGRAAGAARRACDLDPDFAGAQACLGRVKLRMYHASGERGMLDEAIVQAQLAIDLDQDLAGAHLLAGDAQMSAYDAALAEGADGSGHRQAAIAAYRQALALDPSLDHARLRLAEIGGHPATQPTH